MPDKYQNKYRIPSARLQTGDYGSNAAYFITICTVKREHYFGQITNGKMNLSQQRKIANQFWLEIPNHFSFVLLDEFIIMPNHVHGIMVLVEDTYAGAGTSPAYIRHGIPEIVRAFKAFSMMRVNAARRTRGIPLWQRNYYEHIIRNEDELAAIRTYIFTNPQRWSSDVDNPMFREE